MQAHAVSLKKMANELLKSVYYDLKNPAGYASLKKLVNATGLKEQVVRTWLKQQPTFTLHQQARKVYPTRRYVVHDIDEQWQADLAEMGLIARHNDGHRYILTVIDLFSRYAWARPLKTKRGEDVANAFSSIFEEGRIPRRIQTDQGKEFENRHVRRLFQEYNVELFSVKSAYKAALVERFNRTLKHKLWRYFTSENTQQWLPILQDAVTSYNFSIHRIIKKRPVDVTQADVGDMREQRANLRQPPAGKDDIHVGDHVRISKVKTIFEKGYLPNWTEEIFSVTEINRKHTPIMYKLKDYSNDMIEGSFYRHEIQPIIKTDDVYLVERVIRRKRERGELWYLPAGKKLAAR